MRTLAPLLVLALSSFPLACVGPGGAAVNGPKTSLRFRGTPNDATVIVDDETLGPLEFVAKRGVALPEGTHRITVTSVGYFPYDREVVARAGDPPIALDVRLVKVPE